MALHHHHHAAHVARDDVVQTVVSVVYVTASPTFTGAIGGYITLSPDYETHSTSKDAETSTHHPHSTRTETHTHQITISQSISATIPVRSHRPGASSSSSSTSSDDSDYSSSSSSEYPTSALSSSVLPSSTFVTSNYPITSSALTNYATSSAFTSSSMIAASSVMTSNTASPMTTTLSGDTSAATAAELASLEHSQGMSSGAKAGTALGVLLAVGLLAGLAFLFWRRKHGDEWIKSKDDHFDEKRTSHAAQTSGQSSFSMRRSFLNAPRLSLGPISSIFPVAAEKRKSSPRQPMNPFEDPSATIVDEKKHPMLPILGPLAEAIVPKPLSIRSDRTGHATNSPVASPSAPRSRPTGPPQSNVYRVHLDFKPSMDDELELQHGQLVRMVHAYDDGWALCIRMDRSQQGVVPRQCLSANPLKPRPARPAPQPQSEVRAGPMDSQISLNSYVSSDSVPAPLSPSRNRMRAESNPAYHGQDRSRYAPAGSSQVSPEQYDGRQRANSADVVLNPTQFTPAGPRLSPLNPNNLNRKPLPGQAL